ncbi:hypothetical protein B296_00026051 [Ensete ventricosum]|uniref:Uncharacterized protein n=1 Tax=Ensete ventricosum TaxID=4639 RepID=A0A426ZA98_ENSVE|nr:hypothetical protein B296_00026051 [Ensete ventricosum]
MSPYRRLCPSYTRTKRRGGAHLIESTPSSEGRLMSLAHMVLDIAAVRSARIHQLVVILVVSNTAPIPRSIRTKSKGNEPATPEHIPGTSSDDSARAAGLDPFVGVGVMVAILAILVFSGRAAAVVYLCCSLFILHLTRVMSTRPAAHDKIASREVDMDSDEYKKRVILEGLLQPSKHTLKSEENACKFALLDLPVEALLMANDRIPQALPIGPLIAHDVNEGRRQLSLRENEGDARG